MSFIRKAKILAALNEEQKSLVKHWISPKRRISFSDHVFGDKDRVTFPINAENTLPGNIVHHLNNSGYQIHDHTKGIALDRHGRQVRIGKILAKSGQKELEKQFNTHMAKQGNAHNLAVTISRNPYDVAAMSTGQGWTSCMDLKKRGSEKDEDYTDSLIHDINKGTHVAYLHNKDDINLEHPLARIALKPFTAVNNPDKIALRPEDKGYGHFPPSFPKSVQDWAEKHFPLDEGIIYHKPGPLYDDDGRTKIFKWSRQMAHDALNEKNYLSKSDAFHFLKQNHPQDIEDNLHNHNVAKNEVVEDDITPERMEQLYKLHPESKPIHRQMLLRGTPAQQKRSFDYALENDSASLLHPAIVAAKHLNSHEMLTKLADRNLTRGFFDQMPEKYHKAMIEKYKKEILENPKGLVEPLETKRRFDFSDLASLKELNPNVKRDLYRKSTDETKHLFK